MEQGSPSAPLATSLCCVHGPHDLERGTYRRESFVNSVVTDAALSEIKKQSANGCLLCYLEELDGE